MSILDQFNNPDSQYDDGNQFVDTLEAFGYLLLIGWLIHRIIHRGHYASGVVLIISSVAAFLVMVNLDMASDAAYLFWSLSRCCLCIAGQSYLLTLEPIKEATA
jgi:hypothetical protein